MQCINCGSHLEPNWTHCPFCGKFKSVLPEPISDAAIDSIFGKMVGHMKGVKDFVGGPSSYGSGVRQQVFEVIVRQAIAGAPWREICSGPMQVNKITVDEIEAEVQRRLAEGDPRKFKKRIDENKQSSKDAKKGKEQKDAEKGKEGAQDFFKSDVGNESPPAPPRPNPPARPDLAATATQRLQKLHKQLEEFLENAVKDKDQKEYSDAMVAELKEIINAVMRLETILYTIREDIAVATDLERELGRKKKPFDCPDQHGDPHRIDW